MSSLIEKHRKRRTSKEVRAASVRLERASRRLTRAITRVLSAWRPEEDAKIEFLAHASIYRASRYLRTAARLTNSRARETSQARDLVRTALEHVYALAILSKDGKEGLEFLMDWTRRMRASKLRRLLARDGGDQDDRDALTADIEQMISQIGKEKFPRATVQELVDRAGLQELHSFSYSRLNPDSHFDTTSVLEIAYERHEMPEGIDETVEEDVCLASYQILSTLIGLAIACRDIGTASISEELERSASIKDELEATALQVADE